MHGAQIAGRTITERALATLQRPEPLIPASFPLGQAWHVAYTNIKCEHRARYGLEGKGFECFLPMEVRYRVRRGRKSAIRRPVFSRYLFVRFDIELQGTGDVASIDGIEQLLTNNDMPMRVPDRVIAEIRRAEANGAFDKAATLGQGEDVRVPEGPFMGMLGKVQSASPGKRVKVLLEMLGRQVITDFGLAELERTS